MVFFIECNRDVKSGFSSQIMQGEMNVRYFTCGLRRQL
ncbi:hypothetical protein JOE25_003208 [Serratia sp. PL17]|nr:hypothetical protein [Serratia sp. PL17]